MCDTELLSKLAGGDLIALEVKYHSNCAVMYRNRIRSKKREQNTPSSRNIRKYEGMAFFHLVSDIEEYRYDKDAPTFILCNLVKQYDSILNNIPPEGLGPPSTHSTRLKQKLLAEIPDLQFFKKGRQGYLAFNSKITELLHENFGDSKDDIDAKVLRDSVRILRKNMFSKLDMFNGSLLDPLVQLSSIPSLFLSFVKRLLGGASKDNDIVRQPVFSICQLLLCNFAKRRPKVNTDNPRHQRSQEMPIVVYVGLLVHNLTGSAALVDALFRLGLSVSYDRVQQIRKSLADQVCQEFDREGVVWAYSLPKGTPKAYGFDNANKNSTSTTASGSANFNGTVISVFSFGESDEVTKSLNMKEGNPKRKLKLPEYYTDIEPMDKKTSQIPPVEGHTLVGDASKVKEYCESGEMEWLKKVMDVICKGDEINKDSNVTWAAFHAAKEIQRKKDLVHSQILPVFTEASNTPAMVKHCLTVIMKAHAFTNPGETPWVTADQPLFALLKTTQWRFPQTHGEHLIVAVLGAMHTEKAAWPCVGQVEDGSGGPTVMAEAGVTTLGVAESCIHCAHISRSRYLNTVSACVLYMMLKDSYQEYLEHLPPASQPIDIDKWCEDQKSPMFRFYYFLFKLKLLVLQFVRSVRSGNIDILPA